VVPYFYGGEVQAQLGRRQRARGEDARPALQRAEEMYRKGIDINPKLPPLQNGLGRVLFEQAQERWDAGGDPFPLLGQARASFEQAIAITPEGGAAYVNLADVLSKQAEFRMALGEDPGPSVRAAVEAAEKALQRLPDNAEPWSNLGMAHSLQAAFELERGRDPRGILGKAEKELRQAIAKNANYAEGWRHLGVVRELSARWAAGRGGAREEEFEAAAQAFQKAIELDPDSRANPLAFAHCLRAWTSWQSQVGLDPSAVSRRGLHLANGLLSARAGWPEALVLRASFLLSQAETSMSPEQKRDWRHRAVEDFTRALSANPNLERGWGKQAQLAQRLLASSR
jgi:serine/threonine-protein kinase